jgi:hypothetical protein
MDFSQLKSQQCLWSDFDKEKIILLTGMPEVPLE